MHTLHMHHVTHHSLPPQLREALPFLAEFVSSALLLPWFHYISPLCPQCLPVLIILFCDLQTWTHAHTHTLTPILTWTPTYSHTFTCTHTYSQTHIHICVHTHTIHSHMHMHTYIHIYTHMHIHLHPLTCMYTHTYTHTLICTWAQFLYMRGKLRHPESGLFHLM